MPKMGDAMTEGKVLRWYKKAGDAVKKGEAVAEIETDKVNLDLEAEADGTLGELEAAEGEMVPVGGVLATLVGPGEKAEPVQRRKTDKKEEAIEMKAPRVDRAAGDGRNRSSPLARKVARELGVSLDQVQGSGPRGRIIAADVKGVATGFSRSAQVDRLKPAATLEAKSIPLTAMRRTIAKRLAESIGPIPHFFLTVDYDVTNLLALREQINEVEGVKTSLNDYVVRAAALALRHHPNVNASFGDEAIAQHGEIHIGIAVSTPEGLITPVVRNADQKSIMEISNEVRALAEKSKNRKLKPDEYQGSTFTISNLGAWGIEEFTAIINPPNAAILAIGAAKAQPVVVDRQVVIRDRMKVTMSCDHRVVDGVAGAEYLRTLRQYIEQPVRLIL